MAKTRVHGIEYWPEEDRRLWTIATSSEADFFERGKCTRWRPETLRQALWTYGRWLRYLSERHPESLRQAPQQRLSRERLERFLGAYAANVKPQSVASFIGHYINALHAVAPSYNTAFLRRRQVDYQRQATPRARFPKRIEALDLYSLGIDLMNRAAGMRAPHERATTYRDGLLIALLISSPLRRRNLSQLRLQKHLRRVGDQYWIVVDGEETKSGQAIEHALPATLSAYIEQYVEDYRLRFYGAREHDAFWPSTKGGPLVPEALNWIVAARTRAAFGFPINLHRFRSIAVTSFAREMPGAAHHSRDLLGHRNLHITERHYRERDVLTASQRYGAALMAERQRLLAANAAQPT